MAYSVPATEAGASPIDRLRKYGGGLTALLIARVVAGTVLAISSLLMVTDRLSLRELLAETGPEAIRHLVLSLHVEIEHTGAQVVELSGALIGLMLVALSIRSLRRATR